MLRGDLGREMPPAMWCESFLFCLPIKALIKSKSPPHHGHGVYLPLSPPFSSSSLLPFCPRPSPPHPFPLLSMGSNGVPAYRWLKVKSEAGLSKPYDSEAECSKPMPTFPCSRCSRCLAHTFPCFFAKQKPTHSSFKCPHFCEDFCDPSPFPTSRQKYN